MNTPLFILLCISVRESVCTLPSAFIWTHLFKKYTVSFGRKFSPETNILGFVRLREYNVSVMSCLHLKSEPFIWWKCLSALKMTDGLDFWSWVSMLDVKSKLWKDKKKVQIRQKNTDLSATQRRTWGHFMQEARLQLELCLIFILFFASDLPLFVLLLKP